MLTFKKMMVQNDSSIVEEGIHIIALNFIVKKICKKIVEVVYIEYCLTYKSS